MHSILGKICATTAENIKKYFQQEGKSGQFTENLSKEIVGHLKYNCIFRHKMAAKAPYRKDGQSGQKENPQECRGLSEVGQLSYQKWNQDHIKGDTETLSSEGKVNSNVAH